MENRSQMKKCGKMTLARWSMYRCSLLSFFYVTVCLSVCVSHPVQPVSAARLHCQCCVVGRSGEPGSGRRCSTCTAAPGWYLESQTNIKKGQRRFHSSQVVIFEDVLPNVPTH